MNIFHIFDKKKSVTQNSSSLTIVNDNHDIPESELNYYRPDEYYTTKSYEGTPFEKTVITFEERKQTCIPSKTGLYVAEILLLDYCSKGTYPNPKYGYPGFWWFEYGIQNVDVILSSLEERGYIKLCNAANSLKGLTVLELKNLLKNQGLLISGNKQELIERVKNNISESVLISKGLIQKYELTELGQTELKENEYVPYMHKYPYKTNDSVNGFQGFNVWNINKILDKNNKSNWKEIVEQKEKKNNDTLNSNYNETLNQVYEFDPDLFNTIKNQDAQIKLIQDTEIQLHDDIERLIEFWEKIWETKGLLFEGTGWYFRLPDLYIKVKRYDDALKFCEMIKNKKTSYSYKAENYIEKIKIKMKK